jgi:hypothetical protein
MSKGPTHDPVPIWGYPEEWEEVQKASWHATECGWVAFVAQVAQENHERSIWQLAESVGADHVKRMYSDPEYWRNYSIQERNINKLFMSTVDLARQIDKGTLSMIDFGIQLGSLQRMFHQSAGIFYFPQLETHELHQLHGITMGIPSLSDSIFKCEPVPGQLFTNQHGGPPDWVALPEGSKASESATIELAKGDNYDESDELSKPPAKPIDTTPVVSGAARFGYADAIWVGPQNHGEGQPDSVDDGIIRVVYLDDVLFIRRGPEAKDEHRSKADGGADLADGE